MRKRILSACAALIFMTTATLSSYAEGEREYHDPQSGDKGTIEEASQELLFDGPVNEPKYVGIYSGTVTFSIKATPHNPCTVLP